MIGSRSVAVLIAGAVAAFSLQGCSGGDSPTPSPTPSPGGGDGGDSTPPPPTPPSPAPFAPDPRGKQMPDGSFLGAWDASKLSFVVNEGGEDLFEKQEAELVASGFRWTEGPCWVADQSTLFFSDVVDMRLYRWSKDKGAEIFFHESGGYDGTNVPNFSDLFEPGSNGIAFNQGDLYINQHATRRMVKVTLADVTAGKNFSESTYTVVADKSPEGKPLNSPNDVIFDSTGAVYFTDPPYGFIRKGNGYGYIDADIGKGADQPYLDDLSNAFGPGYKGVYRVKNGQIQLLTKDLERPNGLALSKDEKTLWVSQTNADTPTWHSFTVPEDDSLAVAGDVLNPTALNDTTLTPHPDRDGGSDGFKIDEEGRIWSSVPGGIAVFNPTTKKVLAKVVFGGTKVSNLVFGNGGDVFVTGAGHVWRLQRKVAAPAGNQMLHF